MRSTELCHVALNQVLSMGKSSASVCWSVLTDIGRTMGNVYAHIKFKTTPSCQPEIAWISICTCDVTVTLLITVTKSLIQSTVRNSLLQFRFERRLRRIHAFIAFISNNLNENYNYIWLYGGVNKTGFETKTSSGTIYIVMCGLCDYRRGLHCYCYFHTLQLTRAHSQVFSVCH